MTWQDYLASVDDSHQMTTAREHIAELCRLVEGRELRVLELGSHAGISAAAMAIAAPESTVVSVDLCDTMPEESRVEYWSLLGVENIQPITDDAGRFLRQSQVSLEPWDLIFHDAVHGDTAWHEYLTASGICSVLAIHDFEQMGETSRESVRSRFGAWRESTDSKGRVLFIGFHHG